MANFGNAAVGATSGAAAGSAFGPIGAGIGGLAGGVLGLFSKKRKQDKIQNYNPYTPEQQKLINYMAEQALEGNQNAFDWINSILSDEEGAFQDYERPFMEHFQQQTIPSILEKFTGAGARSSSALNQTLAQAGKDLSTNLAAQRANLKQNALQQLSNYSQLGLTQQNTPYIQGGRQDAYSMLAPGTGQLIGNSFTGLMNMLSSRGSSMGGNQNSYSMQARNQQIPFQTNAP